MPLGKPHGLSGFLFARHVLNFGGKSPLRAVMTAEKDAGISIFDQQKSAGISLNPATKQAVTLNDANSIVAWWFSFEQKEFSIHLRRPRHPQRQSTNSLEIEPFPVYGKLPLINGSFFVHSHIADSNKPPVTT